MSEAITVGLDPAKDVFQVHGADGAGRPVLRKKLRRAQVLAIFDEFPPCVVAMEACGGAHHGGCGIGKPGHEVRLIPPAYVKPFVKRQKNDMANAEAVCDAAARPTMRFAPVKSEHWASASALVCWAKIVLRIAATAGRCLSETWARHRREMGARVPHPVNPAPLTGRVDDPARRGMSGPLCIGRRPGSNLTAFSRASARGDPRTSWRTGPPLSATLSRFVTFSRAPGSPGRSASRQPPRTGRSLAS